MILTFGSDTLHLLSVVYVVEESIIVTTWVAILYYEVTWKLMLLLWLMDNIRSLLRLCSWRASLVLIHNVSKVDPLITSLILASVLSWVGCSTCHWVIRLNTHPLLLSGSNKDRWLTMSSTWRLRSLMNLLCIRLCIRHIRRHNMHNSLILLDPI